MLRVKCAKGSVKTNLNTSLSIKKLIWEKLDKGAYVQTLERELVMSKHNESESVDQRLKNLIQIYTKLLTLPFRLQ